MSVKILKKDKQEIICPPRVGEIVEGKIIASESNTLFLDLGFKGIGIIYGRALYESKDILKSLKVGEKILAKITNIENEDGYRELSPKDASKELSWDELKRKKEGEEAFEIKISGANKGGLLAQIMGVSAFLPTSQLSPEHYPRVEGGESFKIIKELQKFVGQKLKVKLFALDQSEEKIILSEKACMLEQIKESLKKYKVSDIVEGKITGITNFGVFIKFGEDGLEGLIHSSEIPEDINKNLPENLKIDQGVKAKIIEINNDRIYLSLKI
jgi:small subunit ribosomal protein S1